MSSPNWVIIPTIGENKNVPNHQHLRLLCEKHMHSLHSQSSMVESLKTIDVTKFANYVHKTDLDQKLDWLYTKTTPNLSPRWFCLYLFKHGKKFPDTHSRVSLQFTQVILYHYYPLVIQNNYGKWFIYRWFVMICLLKF